MKLFSAITHRLLTAKPQLFRRLTTAAQPSIKPPAVQNANVVKKKIYKIFGKRSSNQKVGDVLKKMVENGEKVSRSDLVSCIRGLRKRRKYDPCLQMLEWMDESKYSLTDADYAMRLNLIGKAKGIGEVEKFFDSLPSDHKNRYTYGALLNFYCIKKMTDEAFALFKKMDELNYASNAMAYSNLMSLSLKVGKPEKVPSLVEEMKQRNIPLNNHTYYFWIQSYRNAADLQGLEQLMQEVEMQDSLKEDYMIYSSLASVYTDTRQPEKAFTAWNKVTELLDKSKNPSRKEYHNLLLSYASIGKSECVYQVWDKMKSRYEALINTSYLYMLQALSKLDDIEGLKKYFKEWELAPYDYDERLVNTVIGAYLRHEMTEEAKQLLKDAKANVGKKARKADILFMVYYLGKHQFDSALKHLEAAVAEKWKPHAKNLEPLFNHFIEEKDVDSAEELCKKLENNQALNSKIFLLLLQTYAAAEKTAPVMRERMKTIGLDISPEHEELLQKIC